MTVPRLLYISLVSLLFVGTSFQHANAFCSFRGPHYFSIGPEIYFMQRIKKGGSSQDGVLYGGYASYERIRRSALYWGVDGRYAYGLLKGYNADEECLKSYKMDSQVEGRFGYTFKKGPRRCLWLTPFFGAGYFNGTNRFVEPSPIVYKMRVKFPYILIGFLSKVDVNACFSAGLNFKAKYSVGARGKITGDSDPDVDNAKFYIEDKFMYEVELPFTYSGCCRGKNLGISVVPFYNFRHYGGHENYPFNFIDTKFHLYGARLLLQYAF